MKRGFTIVELLMVVAIISVLIGITVSSVSGSIVAARNRKAEALCTLVEQGLATYYAQKGEWPIEGLADKDPNAGIKADGTYDANAINKTVYLLDKDGASENGEVQKMVMEVVKETAGGHPMMDVSGLFVTRKGVQYGMDFMEAVLGTKKNKDGIRLNSMIFGYPDPKTGKFHHFTMAYSPAADKVTVRQ